MKPRFLFLCLGVALAFERASAARRGGNILVAVASFLVALHCSGADGGSANSVGTWPFRTESEIFSLPCSDSQNIYFGACDGNFYCVDKRSAALKWSRGGFVRVDSDPILANDTVYFASSDDQVHALLTSDGSTKWTRRIPGVGYNNAKLRNAVVLISGHNQLTELNPGNGMVVHRYHFQGEGGEFSCNSAGVAAVANQNVSSNDYKGEGKVMYFKFGSKSPMWVAQLGGSCLGQVSCDDNRCYLGSRDGAFSAFNVTDGTIAWRIDCSQLFGSRTGVVWADYSVVAQNGNNSLVFTACHQDIGMPAVIVCIAKADGKILWKTEHPSSACGSLEGVENTIIAIAQDRHVVTVNINTGKSRVLNILPMMGRGEFAGVKRDGDFVFIVGADACVWRLPLRQLISVER